MIKNLVKNKKNAKKQLDFFFFSEIHPVGVGFAVQPNFPIETLRQNHTYQISIPNQTMNSLPPLVFEDIIL